MPFVFAPAGLHLKFLIGASRLSAWNDQCRSTAISENLGVYLLSINPAEILAPLVLLVKGKEEDRTVLLGRWAGEKANREVPSKAHACTEFLGLPIDGPLQSRYSQAQITDLVAYANPRSLEAAQSLCSSLSHASQTLPKPVASSPAVLSATNCSKSTRTLAPEIYSSGVAVTHSTSLLQRNSGGQRTH